LGGTTLAGIDDEVRSLIELQLQKVVVVVVGVKAAS